jgi:aminoglycoside 6'-N-acetyltransferase
MRLRPATIDDLALLCRWDEQPHVVESDPNDDWQWETELLRTPVTVQVGGARRRRLPRGL